MGQVLTDAFVRALTAPPGGRVEVSDDRCTGLSVRVTAAGVKSWSFKYRDRLTGKVERLSLGRYPTIGLAKAREMADAKRVEVHSGQSPRAEQRKRRAAEKAAITFDMLAAKYLVERVAKKTPASLSDVTSFLRPVRAEWSSKKAKDVSRDDVLNFLSIRAETAPVAANRTRSALVTLFNWAIDEGHLESSPMVRIPKPAEEQSRERVILDDEIPILWRAYGGLDPSFCRAFRTLALLGQRPGEIAGLTVAEVFDLFDPKNARIELGRERTKNRRRHVIPLPDRARALIQEAIDAKSEDMPSPYVFESFRNVGEAIDRHSFSRAMVRLIGGLTAEPETKESIRRLTTDRPTPHDWRRTMVTGLARLGISRDVVKAVVNHAEGDITGEVYDRYDRIPEKRRALEAWEAHVLTLLGETPVRSGVVDIRRRKARA